MPFKNAKNLYNYEYCSNCKKPYTLSGETIYRRNKRGETLLLCVPCLILSKQNIRYERSKQTNLDRYGVENPFQSEDIRQRIREIHIEKRGVENPMQSEEVKSKQRSTNRLKYGVNYGMQNIQIYEKGRRSQTEKYGGIGMGSPITKLKILKSMNTSSTFEEDCVKQVQKFLVLFNDGALSSVYTCIPQYEVNGHSFDFAILYNNKLDTLVDCDGMFFHAYTCDYDDQFSKEYYDDKRLQCVPKGVKFHIILEKSVRKGLLELCNILDFDYNGWIQDQYDWCIRSEFPYYNYSDDELQKSYIALCNYGYDDTIRHTAYKTRISLNSNIGGRIILHFHPSIWKCNTHNKLSPYDAWYHVDKDGKRDLLLQCIENRFIYVNTLHPQKVLQGFNINKIAPKISVFSPSRAKLLIMKYLSDFDTVFDPFSGYSGRMLGTCSLNKRYIGLDINPVTIKESNDIIDHLKLNASVNVSDTCNTTSTYDCLFTCPPYGNKEHWNQDIVVKSAEEWVEICLNNFKCKRYVFMVDSKCNKYHDNCVEIISNRASHFGTSIEKILVFDT